jgi:hypothetical protein
MLAVHSGWQFTQAGNLLRLAIHSGWQFTQAGSPLRLLIMSIHSGWHRHPSAIPNLEEEPREKSSGIILQAQCIKTNLLQQLVCLTQILQQLLITGDYHDLCITTVNNTDEGEPKGSGPQSVQ